MNNPLAISNGTTMQFWPPVNNPSPKKIVNPYPNKLQPIDDTQFYVIAVCSNPIRYHARYRLYKEFQQHMLDVGARLITVECAYGRRPFELTQRDDPYDVQVRTDHELWHKENLVNIGLQYLCQIDPDWKYVGWFDADVKFQRPDIIQEIVHQLQHYDIVQCFSHVIDLGPTHEPIKQQNGFVWSYFENNFNAPVGPGYSPRKDGYYGGYFGGTKGSFWHPGYCWAARREAMERISLFDKAILGSADHHMAMGLIGHAWRSIPQGVTKAYRDAVMNWQEIAVQRLRKNIGFVPGLITHYWHGNKANRQYVDRWKILIENQYDPTVDIARDPQGLYRLNVHCGNRSIKLRDQIRMYFRQRNEDSIDLF